MDKYVRLGAHDKERRTEREDEEPLKIDIAPFIRATSGDVHDVNILDEIMPEAGSFYGKSA